MRLIAAVVGILSACSFPQTCCAEDPQRIHYRGRLIGGTDLVSGSVGISLRLFAAAGGENLPYEDWNTVTVVDGLYSTVLGGLLAQDLATVSRLSRPAFITNPAAAASEALAADGRSRRSEDSRRRSASSRPRTRH